MSIFRRAPPIACPPSFFDQADRTEREKSRHALAEQVTEHFDTLKTPVYCYVLSICGNASEAEELIQDVFLRLYAFLRAGNNIRSVRAWVFRVAHNLAINKALQSRREISTDFSEWIDSGTEPEDETLDPEELYGKLERDAKLLEEIRGLTSHQRRCLQLRAEGFRYREIAGILDVSLASVSDALDRAIKKLRRSSHA